MGQAGAQREPSMEEILASIRRIIENNEPGPDGNPGDAGVAFSQHDAEENAADENAYDADYADQESESQRTAANDAPVAQPVSLADVAARARAVPETRSADAIRTDTHDEIFDHATEVMDAAAEELREALTSDEPVEAPAQAVVAAVKQTQDEPVARQPEAVSSASSSEHRETPVDQHGGGQLVSLQTGEKVAAAFSELDAAIAAGQRRSFDEIAEEMLRPMLTQWLDDNLPTLVERLVREEIERVSRGNRR
jgi:uncharacterized protein